MAKRWTKLKLNWTKKTKVIVLASLGLVAAVIAGFITYYNFPMKAEVRELTLAQNMLTVKYMDTPTAVVLAPLDGAKKGIVLYPGGRVESAAYAYKMSQIAQSGVAVVIVKPPLHLSLLDWRLPEDYASLVDSVSDWYVAGHSMGGAKACQVAASDGQFKGLILLGAYCSGNLSGLSVPVLSIAGSADGLATPAEINSSKSDLPTSTTYEMIEGLNHAGFGDYGKQDRDGDMAIADTDALQKITLFVTRFIGMNAQ